MITFWNSLGEAGHMVIYLGVLSVLAVIFDAMAKQAGILGAIGKVLKAIVDFFSANIKHEPPKA